LYGWHSLLTSTAADVAPPPLQEAEEFAEQDKAVKARIDAKNQLETYAYNIKSTVEDKAKDKVRAQDAHGQCY
jgi:molecular chaperone DnaK (HSP70)